MDWRIDQLVSGVRAGDRRSIARAITLVESARAADDAPAETLLRELARPGLGATLRVGVSGVPGVGKSSFLEALGVTLVEAGHRVAVLAVDPTSSVSGGSILGDKTRMERLSRLDAAYIRPSAGGGQLGGIAPRTREAILVCEAAGFDVILVETIGIGQSEIAVRDVVDTFVLLMLTGAGDDLQGIKRGVLEVADLFVITKADGDNQSRATATASELAAALHILRPQASDLSAPPLVATCSARTGQGIAAIWDAIRAHHESLAATGRLTTRRTEQDLRWFDRKLDELLRRRFLAGQSDALERARTAVREHRELAITAALRLCAAGSSDTAPQDA